MEERTATRPPEVDENPDAMDRLRAVQFGRTRLSESMAWIGEELALLQADIARVRAMKTPGGKPKVVFDNPRDILDAFKAGVLTKAEARSMLGLKKIRQPAALRRARSK